MRGNVYISVPKADISNELPATITSYDWTENVYDEESMEVTSTTNHHPTWEQYGERNTTKFGQPVTVTVEEVEYIVYEIEVSWQNSEVSSLVALGSGLAAPNYTLMTNTEAKEFITSNLPEE